VCGKVKNLNPIVSKFQLFGCINFGWLYGFKSKIVNCVDLMNLLGYVKVIELLGVDFLKIFFFLAELMWM